MIRWTDPEFAEGRFKATFFRDDEKQDELIVYANTDCPDFEECAEKCVDALNRLDMSVIKEICEGFIRHAKESDGFELPALDDPLDILDYWWFGALYVDMENKEDKVGYVVEGEGEWDGLSGFVINDGHVVYAGSDFLEYVRNPK